MRTVAVIGAGQMGSGIAQTVAQNGIKVLLSDVDIALAEKAVAGINKALARLVSREKVTPDEATAALARSGSWAGAGGNVSFRQACVT